MLKLQQVVCHGVVAPLCLAIVCTVCCSESLANAVVYSALFWMLAACRGRWRGRYVDLKTPDQSQICHSGFGRTTVSRSDVCTRGNGCCSRNVCPNFTCLSKSRSAAQLAPRDWILKEKNAHRRSFETNSASGKKGERIWNANTCFSAQRPHRYSLAVWPVICMAWSRQNLGSNKRHKWKNDFVVVV